MAVAGSSCQGGQGRVAGRFLGAVAPGAPQSPVGGDTDDVCADFDGLGVTLTTKTHLNNLKSLNRGQTQ